jgi:DeoR family transcriptional regulator of aga operon
MNNPHKEHEVVFQEERLEKILSRLEKENRLVTRELPELFNTTVVTIRKDLIILEQRGLLKRTHGGAIKTRKLFPGLPLSEKERINQEEKMRIVKKAARLISKGDTIILDSGSTTSLLAREIKHMQEITVITNAMNIAVELLHSNIELILIGGSLIKQTSTSVGPLADEALRKLTADKLFMGIDGIDLETGLTTPNIQEANTSRVMIEISGETIVLADSSKFGRRCLGVICQLKDIDRIITTKKLSDKESGIFRNEGVKVIPA